MYQRGFALFSLIIGILILAGIILGGYYLGLFKPFLNLPESNIPTTQNTHSEKASDWKTYTNTKYNYSIDYPSNWKVREYPDTQEGATFSPPDKSGLSDETESINITASQKPGNLINDSFTNYVQVAASQEVQNYEKLATIKEIINNDGVKGYETTWMVQPLSIDGQPPSEGQSESLPITYFELPDSKNLVLRVVLNQKEDLATYEQMLKTVKVKANPNITPTPTPDQKTVLESVMKKSIALKHKSDESSLDVSVSTIEGDYAKGMVSDSGGGGLWFAAFEDGVWKLVWDGNGIIECSTFDLYPNFPTSMIPECYDTQAQKLVKR
ncbi:hypothetical protein M1563_04115 [Patescibacteria group bacterium]|nr:hypothetical protein [Patescibacteria group bacterium]